MTTLTLKQRMRLMKFMRKIGFLIDETAFQDLATENQKITRIHTLIKRGYRVIENKDKTIEVINVLNGQIDIDTLEEIQNIYFYLTSK